MDQATTNRPTHPFTLPLSAPTEDDLRTRAARLGALLREQPLPDEDPAELARTAGTAGLGHGTGADGPHRAVVVADGRAELLDALDALAAGAPAPAGAEITAGRTGDGRLAFLFTGQGAQRPGMGRELYETFPGYADAFDEVCHVLDAYLPRPLRDVVHGTDAELLSRTEFTQPATFAVEVALYWVLESWGLRPDVLAGHSIGEFAAAHAAGILSLDDAARLVAARGRLMQALPVGGVMVAVLASEEEVLPLLAGREDSVGVAAVNGPTSVVLAGAAAAVDEVVAEIKAMGRKARQLVVSHAFHSPLMDPVLDEFREVAAGVTYGEPRIPLVSTLTGEPVTAGTIGTPDYWVRHIRSAVRFADAVATLERDGVTTFVEVGPDAILTSMGKGCLRAGSEAVLLPAMRRGRPEARTLLSAVARAHVRGAGVDWTAFHDGCAPLPVPARA
ncbi:hypothetical protein GCM10010218_65160 [Streptomyces mashuensis]|uniref:Malonyl-CoA:ACP transacylase (MAT) domain-containing protein n=1 Tax=Streptomyces mashuensis TaxID=33904 RepID=A0A919EGW9_9ACTN|nr:acyltransferase domain-containing protein [Streptomyces mashuensis]GHF75068.1 hypothetical protein GCM10010218_65160 [Streptomyces mashuensis]